MTPNSINISLFLFCFLCCLTSVPFAPRQDVHECGLSSARRAQNSKQAGHELPILSSHGRHPRDRVQNLALPPRAALGHCAADALPGHYLRGHLQKALH